MMMHLAPKQKSSCTGQLHSKRLVLLQLPACESHFQFYSGTLFYIDVIHLCIYIYNYIYIYIYIYIYMIYMIYEFPIFVASVPTEKFKSFDFPSMTPAEQEPPPQAQRGGHRRISPRVETLVVTYA